MRTGDIRNEQWQEAAAPTSEGLMANQTSEACGHAEHPSLPAGYSCLLIRASHSSLPFSPSSFYIQVQEANSGNRVFSNRIVSGP